jgi:hypothetical protein
MHRRAQRNDYAFTRPTFDEVAFENQNGVLVALEWNGEHLQPSPEALYVTQEAHRALLAALATLPAEQQRTVRLHYFDGLPLAEVALLLGVPVGAVKVRLHRARVRLRIALTGEPIVIRAPVPRVEEVLMIDVTTQTGMERSGGGGIRLPFLPTRDIVISPHMVVPLYIGRRKSVKAIEEAMAKKVVFLVLQRDAKVNNPTDKDLYEIGTVADIV